MSNGLRTVAAILVTTIFLSGCFMSNEPVGRLSDAISPASVIDMVGPNVPELRVHNEDERLLALVDDNGESVWILRLYPVQGAGFVAEVLLSGADLTLLGGRDGQTYYLYGLIVPNIAGNSLDFYLDEAFNTPRAIRGEPTDFPIHPSTATKIARLGRYVGDGPEAVIVPNNIAAVAQAYQLLIADGMPANTSVSWEN